LKTLERMREVSTRSDSLLRPHERTSLRQDCSHRRIRPYTCMHSLRRAVAWRSDQHAPVYCGPLVPPRITFLDLPHLENFHCFTLCPPCHAQLEGCSLISPHPFARPTGYSPTDLPSTRCSPNGPLPRGPRRHGHGSPRLAHVQHERMAIFTTRPLPVLSLTVVDALHMGHNQPLHRLPLLAHHLDNLPHRLDPRRHGHNSRLRSRARGFPAV